MTRCSWIFALPLLLAAVCAAQPGDSLWIESRPLQVKLDRLYLDCGLEARVFPDCRFVVHRGPDSLYSGCIESSYPGVAVSSPVGGFFDTLRLADLRVWLERAPYDTLAPIVLGQVGLLPAPLAGVGDSTAGGRVVFRPYASHFEASLAFEDQVIDGFFSYRRYTAGGEDVASVSRPAPFFVALVPNPARAIAQRGFLSTSLYYRLDPQRLAMIFEGDELRAFNRCGVGGDTAARPYPYAPGPGRALLNNLRGPSRSVVIAVEHPMFEPAAGYFADILSRDRFRPTVTSTLAGADLRLVAVPLGESEADGLRCLSGLLALDTLAGSAAAQSLQAVSSCLDSAALAAEPAAALRYVQLAESVLRDDLGVFPLFRPTLYFTARRSLLGEVFDRRGGIDVSGLARVRIPQNRKDCRP
ncbi:MAG TPA: hypothetical protein PLR32_00585 [candidate division Zixibacteria bacterium]|nr:hypothetical protein [candidate division Zixibacteria bacterium]MDD4917149.1 hypothetical protein [candidate division Zixibacteria bacterium]MDM7972667.1 hypothetical protein [candidate division Zixibacteria bacterium]HOD65417.1 hypothetical protein [candidate division Zixibacteria bacterium]HPC11011.1 hypothetical protein [candidate division Zixibacteria bacterium]